MKYFWHQELLKFWWCACVMAGVLQFCQKKIKTEIEVSMLNNSEIVAFEYISVLKITVLSSNWTHEFSRWI